MPVASSSVARRGLPCGRWFMRAACYRVIAFLLLVDLRDSAQAAERSAGTEVCATVPMVDCSAECHLLKFIGLLSLPDEGFCVFPVCLSARLWWPSGS